VRITDVDGMRITGASPGAAPRAAASMPGL